MRKRTGHGQAPVLPALIQRQSSGVHQRKDHIVPARPMPDAGDEHGNEGSQHHMPELQLPEGLDNGHVDAGRDGIGQGDMPALPEIRKAGSPERRLEVGGDLYIHHPRHADGHVTVTGKIEVQLQAVADGHQPAIHQGQAGSIVKAMCHIGNEAVCDKHFFTQADDEKGQPPGQVLPVRLLQPVIGELGHHGLVVEDGACQQMGEEGNEEGIAYEVMLPRHSHIAVQKVDHLGDGKEGDAQGQHQLQKRQLRPQKVQVLNEEIQIFIEAQQADVEGQPHEEPSFQEPPAPAGFHPLPCPDDAPGDEPVHHDAAQQQGQIAHIPVTIENKAQQEQPDIGRPAAPPAQQKIAKKCDRQEGEDKSIGIKEHFAPHEQ